jgi:protoporphyrinogen oxidase
LHCSPLGRGAQALAAVEALGLAPLTLASAPAASKRFLIREHALTPLPGSLPDALRSPLTRDAPRWIWRDLLEPALSRAAAVGAAGAGPDAPAAGSEEADDESVAALIERRFGPAVARTLVDAALSGIYAGDLDALSARAIMPSLVEAERRGGWGGGGGSVVLGLARARWAARNDPPSGDAPSPFVAACAKASSVSFVDGMETLPRALAAALRGASDGARGAVEIFTGARVTRLEVASEKGADGGAGKEGGARR